MKNTNMEEAKIIQDRENKNVFSVYRNFKRRVSMKQEQEALENGYVDIIKRNTIMDLGSDYQQMLTLLNKKLSGQ